MIHAISINSMTILKAHNLAYVCDADLTLSMVRTYDESIADKLEQLAPNSQADQEQYSDFYIRYNIPQVDYL